MRFSEINTQFDPSIDETDVSEWEDQQNETQEDEEEGDQEGDEQEGDEQEGDEGEEQEEECQEALCGRLKPHRSSLLCLLFVTHDHGGITRDDGKGNFKVVGKPFVKKENKQFSEINTEFNPAVDETDVSELEDQDKDQQSEVQEDDQKDSDSDSEKSITEQYNNNEFNQLLFELCRTFVFGKIDIHQDYTLYEGINRKDETDTIHLKLFQKCSFALDMQHALFSLCEDYTFLSDIESLHSDIVLYKAIDKKTNLEVCLKIFIDPTEVVPTEVRILEHIRRNGGHKNIQEMLNVHHFEKIAWVLVSRYYDSNLHYEEMCMFNNQNNISLFMKQLLKAISFLHSIGIMHRDIKPSNILWNDVTKKLILFDFDLATWITEKGHCFPGGVEGYTAPEMIAFKRDVPRKNYSFQIDLFAAGCVYGGFTHSVLEEDMTEMHIYKFRRQEEKKPILKRDWLFLNFVERNPAMRPTSDFALGLHFDNSNLVHS